MVVVVSTLNEYFGRLFSTLVVYFLPPGPVLTDVVTMDAAGELAREDFAIVAD